MPAATARPNREVVAHLPMAPGVYRFRDGRGIVLYIGRATDLRHRVRSYWSDLGERAHLSWMVARVDRIEAVACDSVHEAAWLERNLLERSLPRWNVTPGGQEVPVYLRLDGQPHAPGLSVAHLVEPRRGVRWYGPYVGGSRVRLAVAALDRILPLSYTGTGMTGGEREFARRHGVGESDRGWLIDAVAAVLARHPDAVNRANAALAEELDRAVAALAFERAAAIRAETEALAWITSPQRVVVDDGGDLDVYGYADGLLVQFAIRGGRLSGWMQRRAGAETARPKLAATPPDWADFTHRNAELAAALAAPFTAPRIAATA